MHVRMLFKISLLAYALAAAPQASAADQPTAPAVISTPDLNRLLAALADEQKGYYAAIDLAKLGPTVVPTILEKLRSDDPIIRQWAARTLANLGAEKAAAGREAIVQGLATEQNEHALFYIIQAADVLRPSTAAAVPAFIKILKHSSVEVRRCAAEALGHIGRPATVAKPALFAALAEAGDDWLRLTIVQSLDQIGIDAADAQLLASAKLPDDSAGARDAFRLLVRSHPDAAVACVQNHPKLLASIRANDLALIDLFARADAPANELRAFLSRRPDLPPFIRVDYAKGEQIGHVMTLPRKVDPRICFSQYLTVVRIEPGRAVLDSVKTDPNYRLWDAEGLVVLVIGDQYGFVDAATGRIVVEPRFESAENFSDGRASVTLGGKYGYIDKSGALTIPATFNWGYAFQNRAAAVRQEDKFGLIDLQGRWIKPPTYKRIDPSGDGWKACTFDEVEGMLDTKGELLPPP